MYINTAEYKSEACIRMTSLVLLSWILGYVVPDVITWGLIYYALKKNEKISPDMHKLLMLSVFLFAVALFSLLCRIYQSELWFYGYIILYFMEIYFVWLFISLISSILNDVGDFQSSAYSSVMTSLYFVFKVPLTIYIANHLLTNRSSDFGTFLVFGFVILVGIFVTEAIFLIILIKVQNAFRKNGLVKRNLKIKECLVCHAVMPFSTDYCTSCGWTYKE